jgi:hypothetical protein
VGGLTHAELTSAILKAATEALVVCYPRPPFSYVPKDSGWIYDINDPKAPWLHGRRGRRPDIEFSGLIKSLNVHPPGVKIIDH